MILLTRVPVKSQDFSFQYADQHDDVSDESFRRIYDESAAPARIAGLVSDWWSRPKHYVNSYEEFEEKYSEILPSYTQFEAAVAYSLLYNTEKWRVVVGVDSTSGETTLRLQLRNIHKDFKPFTYDFMRDDYLQSLHKDHTQQSIRDNLHENGFIVPLEYVINPTPRVDSLPFTVSDWLPTLNQETTPLVDFATFQGFFENMQEAPLFYQRMMFAYFNNLQQWDITFNKLDTHNKNRRKGATSFRPGRGPTSVKQKRMNNGEDENDDRRRAFTVGNKRYRADPSKRASYTGLFYNSRY